MTKDANEGNTVCPRVGAMQWTCTVDECTCHLIERLRKKATLDDCRLQMPGDNVFRYCAQNGMPSVSADDKEKVCLRTAAEIEAERLASKPTPTPRQSLGHILVFILAFLSLALLNLFAIAVVASIGEHPVRCESAMRPLLPW